MPTDKHEDYTFDEYQKQAVTTAIYPKDLGIIYLALGLAGEAGEVAEKIKKLLRDSGGVLTKERREDIVKEMGDCYWYLANLASELGCLSSDVAKKNIEKLFSRKERGKLHGQGDSR